MTERPQISPPRAAPRKITQKKVRAPPPGAGTKVARHGLIRPPKNAEQMWAVQNRLFRSLMGVIDLAKRVETGTDEDVLAYAMAKDRHQTVQATVAGITAEAGRALRAFQRMASQGVMK